MRILASYTALLALTACGGSYDLALSNDAEEPQAAGDGTSTDDAFDGENPPPEDETSFLVLAPSQTDIYVFVANPDRDTVTRVHAFTYAVDTVPVGRSPSIVLTTPDYATAVVFNEGDDTVTLLDANTLAEDVVEVRPNLNQMILSPDGAWAALWRDPDAVEEDDITDGLVSFNELDLVNIATAESTTLAVGAYPHDVVFTPDGATAIVVSDDELALIDLTTSPLERELIAIAEDLVNPPAAEEVVLAPDGSYAFVRQFGVEQIVVIDLASRTVDRLDAGSNPTDLDITPDGTRAVVVARDSNELWLFDIADPWAAPEVLALPEELVNGSLVLDPSGRRGVLYSTAVAQDVYATWEIATGVVTPRQLAKPIEALTVSPTGDTVLIFHSEAPGPDSDPLSPLYDSPALTMIDLNDFGTTPVKMPAPLAGYANSNNGRFGYFIMEDQPLLGVLDYAGLVADTVFLSSPAEYVGAIPDLDLEDGDEPPAWVSQLHDLGRITFFDSDDGAIQTITGFELNSEIED